MERHGVLTDAIQVGQECSENIAVTGFSDSRKHLHRYCNEFSYRWNERKTTDEVRTAKAIALSGGARLMYQDPIRTAPKANDPHAPF